MHVVTETTALLRKPFEFIASSPHAGPCNHGTFSPRLESRAESVGSGSDYGFGGAPRPRENEEEGESSKGMFGSFLENIGMKNGTETSRKKMSTTNWLAERHGITNTTSMYVSQIFLRQYASWPWTHADNVCTTAGTSHTIFPFSPGSDNTNGYIYKAIS